jgi:hypothetical protein
VRDHMCSIVLLGVLVGGGSLLVAAAWRLCHHRFRRAQ